MGCDAVLNGSPTVKKFWTIFNFKDGKIWCPETSCNIPEEQGTQVRDGKILKRYLSLPTNMTALQVSLSHTPATRKSSFCGFTI